VQQTLINHGELPVRLALAAIFWNNALYWCVFTQQVATMYGGATIMRSTAKTLLLASALAIGATAAFAQSYRAPRYDSPNDDYYDARAVRPLPPINGDGYNYRFRNPPYGLGRLYRLDPDTCRPGACRDNPYY
jgi:hypothetical protein